MKKTWLCIEIACDVEASEEVAAWVAEAFAVGVEITDVGVKFYLDEDQSDRAWTAKLDRLLAEIRESAGVTSPVTYSFHLIDDWGWADRWKDNFKPLRVGRHLIVSPTWEEVSAGEDDIILRIDPGRAFGTGHHETTRLCLEWLEERACGNQAQVGRRSLLDLGTGSGILAIAAAFLGYGVVVGIDNDPEAIEVARENLRVNGLEQKVELKIGELMGGAGCFHEVLANIQANPLIGLAPVLAGSLCDQGRLVLSGILLEQKQAVGAAYAAQGLRMVRERVAGEWCLLVFKLANEVSSNDKSAAHGQLDHTG